MWHLIWIASSAFGVGWFLRAWWDLRKQDVEVIDPWVTANQASREMHDLTREAFVRMAERSQDDWAPFR